VRIGSKEPSSSPPIDTKQGIFIDHQARDLHWPPSKGSSLTTNHGILHWPPSKGSSVTTKHGILHWPPSKGSSVTTKHGILHWPPSKGSSVTTKHGILPPPFSFSLKGSSDDWGGLSLPWRISLNTYFTSFLKGMGMRLRRGKKERSGGKIL
jgi:hypothetical protein